MKFSFLIILVLSVLPLPTVLAADEGAKFAAKGAGRKVCSSFLQSAENKGNDYLLFGGWLEGYLTSYNQFQPNNYDISPWQTTELLLILLQRHCKSNPDIKYLDAVNSLIKSFFPIRLPTESQLVKIEVNGNTSYYYQEILQRAKDRLKVLGYYHGDVDGTKYDSKDVAVFSQYQEKHGMTVTGIPDQYTLSSLFLKSRK